MSPFIEPTRLSTTLRAPLSEHGEDDEQAVPEPVGDAYNVVCIAAWATAGAAVASPAYAADETNPSAPSKNTGRDHAARVFTLGPHCARECSCRVLCGLWAVVFERTWISAGSPVSGAQEHHAWPVPWTNRCAALRVLRSGGAMPRCSKSFRRGLTRRVVAGRLALRGIEG